MTYLPSKDEFINYWGCDIEADDLSPTRVWVVCAVNLGTQEEKVLTDYDEIRSFFAKGGYFVFHNGIGFDAPSLNRLCGTRITPANLRDTLVYSQLYSPSLEGGHSLKSWGDRLRFQKGEFNDFSRLSDEMIEYCLQDARLCGRIFVALVNRMRKSGFTETGLDIEHRSWALIQKQKRTGFYFDIEKAFALYSELRQLENDIRDRVHEVWPPTLRLLQTYRRPFRKDGSPSAQYLRHLDQYERVCLSQDRTEYECFGRVPFNIGSPLQRVEKLLELGWSPRPDERTPTGSPKPTSKGQLVPSLEEFVSTSGEEGPRLIANWMEINARANMVNTWLEAVDDDSRIRGSLWLANTLRYRHSDPNTANIPAVRVSSTGECLRGIDGVYTYEARDCWTVGDRVSRRLVGVDAKGIQLRVLAHYLNNPDFTKAVLDGDPHSYNQEIGGFRARSIAKTFIYAFLLGAGDAKVGQIIGGTSKEGREIKGRFVQNFPGLADLLSNLERQVERTGRIVLCDGTPLAVTHPHTRLGYLLQGDESRIMKKAAILIDQQINRRRLDCMKVGDIHDEFQFDCALKDVDVFIKEVLPACFKEAGEFFNYRLPIECDAKAGLSWSQTH